MEGLIGSVKRLFLRNGSAESSEESEPDLNEIHRPTEYESKSEFIKETGMDDSEYVLELVAAGGGRLKQQTVVEHSGWSSATVSRLLGRMEENGAIEREEFGREKVILFPKTDGGEMNR